MKHATKFSSAILFHDCKNGLGQIDITKFSRYSISFSLLIVSLSVREGDRQHGVVTSGSQKHFHTQISKAADIRGCWQPQTSPVWAHCVIPCYFGVSLRSLCSSRKTKMDFKEIKLWDSSQEKNVPSGYEFVSSGNRYLTTTMKKLCRDQGACIYSRMKKGPKFNFATGYFVPRDVVVEAETRRVESAARREKQRMKAAVYRVRREAKYVKEFQEVIVKQFPGFPKSEVESVADRACKVGSERVGRTKQLSLDEKVRLAVAAHARHEHTNYEELLGDTWTDEEYREVRSRVAPEVDSILETWRSGKHVSIDNGKEE